MPTYYALDADGYWIKFELGGARPITGDTAYKLRLACHMTQQQFGSLFGVHQPSVSHWEHSDCVPKWLDRNAEAILRAYGRRWSVLSEPTRNVFPS